MKNLLLATLIALAAASAPAQDDQQSTDTCLTPSYSFLHSSHPAALITGLKRAEDDSSLIVRLYESHGIAASTEIASPLKFENVQEVNFVEDVVEKKASQQFSLKPYQIKTLKLAASKGTR